ncbi:hypothetical protein [Mycoplasma sp. SG1]|uniref:hypothetical protein n=1 Tax=Mycoplasma sp. SG1 TaxID=2810348 RepID=UPI0020241497|nr:hypothetical protein [Mycoplasma sp. SG1]URM53113.1 hypothetical protein JRW51_02065 [Mycoplasma sp. SG1]
MGTINDSKQTQLIKRIIKYHYYFYKYSNLGVDFDLFQEYILGLKFKHKKIISLKNLILELKSIDNQKLFNYVLIKSIACPKFDLETLAKILGK